MRYEEQLEHVALTLATTPPGQATAVSATCGLGPRESDRFLEVAREVARRFDLDVLVEQDDDIATASFYRRNAATV